MRAILYENTKAVLSARPGVSILTSGANVTPTVTMISFVTAYTKKKKKKRFSSVANRFRGYRWDVPVRVEKNRAAAKDSVGARAQIGKIGFQVTQ
jgi:hypothetical protein